VFLAATGIGKDVKSEGTIMGYLKTGLGFGLGYVLGARAGRQRYERLLADARRLGAHPKVQEAAEKLPPVVQQGLSRIVQQPGVTGLTEAGIADPAPPSPTSSAPTGPLEPEPELLVVDLESVPDESLSQPPIDPLVDPLVVPGHGDLPRSSPRDLQ
jgi:hypothetical protein